MTWRARVLAGLSAVTVVALSGVSSAQEAAGGPDAPAATPDATSEAPTANDAVRRDPKGITGISPFWEAVVAGDRAYVARSFPTAIEAYKKAIAAEPNNPMGHYRAGQAHVAAAQLAEAEEAYEAALRYVGSDSKLKGKILFVLADLRERQKDDAGAVERWTAYGEQAKQSDAEGYPATAEERKRVIAKWKELREQYAEVKARIQKREQEAEAKLKASSK